MKKNTMFYHSQCIKHSQYATTLLDHEKHQYHPIDNNAHRPIYHCHYPCVIITMVFHCIALRGPPPSIAILTMLLFTSPHCYRFLSPLYPQTSFIKCLGLKLRKASLWNSCLIFLAALSYDLVII